MIILQNTGKERKKPKMRVKVKKLFKDAKMPLRGSEQAAGYDLYAYVENLDECLIHAHTTQLVGTGLSMAIPNGYFGAIFARSGLASKKGLRPANCVGVIDSDYRGEIKVALHNDTDEIQKFENGERIAQIIILPYYPAVFVEANDLDETIRGTGGFSSTGSK